MDEADSYSLPKSFGQVGCITSRDNGEQGIWTGKHNTEDVFQNDVMQKDHWLASSHPSAQEPREDRREHGTSLDESASLSKMICKGMNGHEGLSLTPEADNQGNGSFLSDLYRSWEPRKDINNLPLGIGCQHAMESVTDDKIDLDVIEKSPSGFTRCLQGNSNPDNMPRGGFDEPDQGQVMPAFSLTGDRSEYPQQLPNNQYYPEPGDDLPKSPSNTTVSKSSQPSSGCLKADIRDTNVASRNDDIPACRAISVATTQGQQPNSNPSTESKTSEEVAKRKMYLEETGKEDPNMNSMIKKQKMSPTVQSDVQYSHNVLSMPKEYKVSGTGNYLFDSPSNCTFHLYQNQSSHQSQKQHAFEWANLTTQTDSGHDTACQKMMPKDSLETVAKLIAQTTNWKTFARRLPMSEDGNLEMDIKTLEECEGTTSDKTTAVLMRWWSRHPEQSDATIMKARLKEGLEFCSLIRLSRTLDKYL
ncbi:uncharacterized protein LOC110982100 [Acanthaster planci]|uniref:Uncharacterized protein LOC110982100 n=1 Tax=Acanthaster planci TaxID=133434 RepID=A0A8B7YRQ9_ACAPL|nr:uncharacterized protein LOC110982100 [Acanthaster planci]